MDSSTWTVRSIIPFSTTHPSTKPSSSLTEYSNCSNLTSTANNYRACVISVATCTIKWSHDFKYLLLLSEILTVAILCVSKTPRSDELRTTRKNSAFSITESGMMVMLAHSMRLVNSSGGNITGKETLV